MRKRLINYDVFNKLQESSLAKTHYELAEAADSLAACLDMGPLAFRDFDKDQVIYETVNGTFVRANYRLDNKNINFNDIEEIILDEDTAKAFRREKVKELFDAIMEDRKPECETAFQSVLEVVCADKRRKLRENAMRHIKESSVFARMDPRKKGKIYVRRGPAKHQHLDKSTRRIAAKKAWMTRHRNDPTNARLRTARRSNSVKSAFAARIAGRKHKAIRENFQLIENVYQYIDVMEDGHLMSESIVTSDNKGMPTQIVVPTAQKRNEGKLLDMGIKTLKADVKVLRESAKRLGMNREFCEFASDLKRYNNISDNASLEESLHRMTGKFSNVLYLTQDELAQVIDQALDNVNVANYDDKTCNFMAEAVLRTAYGSFTDRVARINQLANVPETEDKDAYPVFQEAVNKYYPTLDNVLALEMRVFTDLHEAVSEINEIAGQVSDTVIQDEAALHLASLDAIISGETVPSLEVAEEVAVWLEMILNETNLNPSTWEVRKKPGMTVNGDVPEMAEKARTKYDPASDGDSNPGDPILTANLEKKGYSAEAGVEARTRSWGNKGGSNVYPDLENPYLLKAGDYTMKGETGVDKNWEDGLGSKQGNTWPDEINPYLPKSEKLHVSDDNKVDQE